MKLESIRISNFQSFGKTPVKINFNDETFLIGPNGSGKTAVLQALCRLFAFDKSLRSIRKSDFHIPVVREESLDQRELWIEADFVFPELDNNQVKNSVVPLFCKHIRLMNSTTPSKVRFRLEARIDNDDEIEESFTAVTAVDSNENPLKTYALTKQDRNQIHVHYLPARRDPTAHLAYGANAILGRLLRSVSWNQEREKIQTLTEEISETFESNTSVNEFTKSLKEVWGTLHNGNYLKEPKLTFTTSEMESLLRNLSLSFLPGHEEKYVDFSRLSDGQKSLLYLSIVLSFQEISRQVSIGNLDKFDPVKLRPAAFTLIALEEPENSLSPYYLGRIKTALNSMINKGNAQAVIASHSPSVLRRVDPDVIRYLRLDNRQQTTVSCISLPDKLDEAHKFVREAVQAYPEIYFARLVVLGEGDSELIVLPRLLEAMGYATDLHGVIVAPLGGRHVNHFWRLLAQLDIPYVTLLDLDVGRFQGGWGRIKYVHDQLEAIDCGQGLNALPKDFNQENVRMHKSYLEKLEQKGVFFSEPLDLDFAMITKFPKEYKVQEELLDQTVLKSVCGSSCTSLPSEYNDDEGKLFHSYHKLFKLGSKPVAHIEALTQLTDERLLESMPSSLERLMKMVISKVKELPE